MSSTREPSVIEHLKRRKIVQRGLAYLAVAWIALEVLAYFQEYLHWPESVVRAGIVALGAGFFAAMILAWYHGEKGHQRARPLELVLLAAVVLAGGGASLIVALGGSGPGATASGAARGSDSRPQAGDGPVYRERWIAVLPFLNLTGDPEKEYLSTGLTLELTTALNKVGDLRVTSPGSVLRFRDRSELSLSQIAGQLRVATLLDGAVRAAGDLLKIDAQLVEPRTGEQIWGDSYERELSTETLFDVQVDVATRIADALHAAHETPGEWAERPTESLEAYNAYLRGLYHFNQAGPAGLTPSIEEYERAIELDPDFALAHAGLAESYLAFAHFGMPPHRAFPEGIRHAREALRLNSELADAHTVLADSKFHYEWDWEGAEREFRRALELRPTFSTANWWYAGLLAAMGRFDEAIVQVETARTRDPLAPLVHTFAGRVYHMAGRAEEAQAAARGALELNESNPFAHSVLGAALLLDDRTDEAVAAMQRAVELAEPPYLAWLVYALAADGRTSEARRALERLRALAADSPEGLYVPPYNLAIAYAALGETEQALDQLEAATETRDATLIWVDVEPVFARLRQEPRFQALVRRMGLEP